MCLREGIGPDQFWELTFGELDNIIKGKYIAEQRRWEHTRLIISGLTGTPPADIVRLPDIDGPTSKIEWTPEMAMDVLKHFGEYGGNK